MVPSSEMIGEAYGSYALLGPACEPSLLIKGTLPFALMGYEHHNFVSSGTKLAT